MKEAVSLKPEHIDADQMQIRVVQGKGQKDRYTLLGEKALDLLRLYWRVYRPTNARQRGPCLHPAPFGSSLSQQHPDIPSRCPRGHCTLEKSRGSAAGRQYGAIAIGGAWRWRPPLKSRMYSGPMASLIVRSRDPECRIHTAVS